MDKIPVELISDITSKLSIADTVSMSKVDRRVTSEERGDPSKYLGETFQHPMCLLASMADSGTIISGSRALEYFFPGSMSQDSGWDFYVPGDATSVHMMMVSLEVSGATWDQDHAKMRSFVMADAGHETEMSLDNVYKADYFAKAKLNRYRQSDIPELNRLSRIMEAISTVSSEVREEVLNLEGHLNSIHSAEYRRAHIARLKKVGNGHMEGYTEVQIRRSQASVPDYCDNFFNSSIVTGKILTHGREETIRMIVCKDIHNQLVMECPLREVTRSYGSHLQCFISGWCAVHLFPKITSARESIRWDSTADSSTDAAVRKYEKRGYSFESPSVFGPYEFPARRLSVYNGNVMFLSFTSFYKKFIRPDKVTEMALERRMSTLKRSLGLRSWYMSHHGDLEMATDEELLAAKRAAVGSPNAPREHFHFYAHVYNCSGAHSEHAHKLNARFGTELIHDMLMSGIMHMVNDGKPWRSIL